MCHLEIVANETTALSTHVLPTKDQIERPDIAFWDTLSGSLSMLYTPALVEPLGRAPLGLVGQSRDHARAGLPVPDHVPDSDRQQDADEAMLAALMPGARASFEEVAARGTVVLPLEFPGNGSTTHRADGRLEACAARTCRRSGTSCAPGTRRRWDGRPLCFISRRQRRKLNAALSFLGSPADIILHPQDAAAHGIVHGDASAGQHEPR